MTRTIGGRVIVRVKAAVSVSSSGYPARVSAVTTVFYENPAMRDTLVIDAAPPRARERDGDMKRRNRNAGY